MTVKDFNRHNSNGGNATASTSDEIRTFKYNKKGHSKGYRAKGSSGKACSKCSTPCPSRECPAFGKKCHKCGNNHSVLVASQKKRAREMAKNHPMIGAQRDITDPKADAPN